jgi:hypothetical protein
LAEACPENLKSGLKEMEATVITFKRIWDGFGWDDGHSGAAGTL